MRLEAISDRSPEQQYGRAKRQMKYNTRKISSGLLARSRHPGTSAQASLTGVNRVRLLVANGGKTEMLCSF